MNRRDFMKMVVGGTVGLAAIPFAKAESKEIDDGGQIYSGTIEGEEINVPCDGCKNILCYEDCSPLRAKGYHHCVIVSFDSTKEVTVYIDGKRWELTHYWDIFSADDMEILDKYQMTIFCPDGSMQQGFWFKWKKITRENLQSCGYTGDGLVGASILWAE